MLGLKQKDFENVEKVESFVKGIVAHFDHMLISEYPDESLILMRRKLCWEISDILYLSLNVKTYSSKESNRDGILAEKLKNWSKADLILYNIFNETLWNGITEHGSSFWDELEFYQAQTRRIYEFCTSIVNLVEENTGQVREMLESSDHIIFPKSPWGGEYKIDHVWCLMSKLNLMAFKNIIRVKEYPELCNLLTSDSHLLSLNKFNTLKSENKFGMNPMHCSKNLTAGTSSYQVPVEVLLDPKVYTTGF